jgi:hypothetical protein
MEVLKMQQNRDNPDFITGHNIPGGDGGVGDEQVNAIEDDGTGKPTGRDHSMDHHEQMDPTDGVGAIQDSSDTLSDVANIADQNT